MKSTKQFRPFDEFSKSVRILVILLIVAIVGLFDYLTGYELNFSAFYLFPVILAVWYVSRGFAVLVSAFCVAVSMAGDLIAGVRLSLLVLVWNAAIVQSFYFVVIWILEKLRVLHSQLEERVRQRTASLNLEMRERMRLEEEILRISEREQRRIGHDLHDSLCQHLTGTALAGQVLSGQLAAKSLPEVAAIDRIVKLVEEAIELTRTLARGLHPVELKGEGFADALRELAAKTSEVYKTRCEFECERGVVIREPGDAIHLYRITQEAITNAVKHSKAREIVVRLKGDDDGAVLTISDDGIGIPETRAGGKGMGLRIMAYRASVIGAIFNVERLLPHGTSISCRLAWDETPFETNESKNQSAVG